MVIEVADVDGWQADLSAALTMPSGLDDRGRVDALSALERLVCTATAAQAQLTQELNASQRRRQAAAGMVEAQRGKGIGHQVALARRESPHRGRRHVGLAEVVVAELPCTWAAWRAGRISEWKATLIARETACLPVERRLEVDRLVAGDADRLERMGDRELAGAAASEAARLDPASVTKRRRKAESERCVTLRPAPDTMCYLTALLPVKDGVATYAALTRVADTARAAGDRRGKGQVMADALVGSVASRAEAGTAAGTGPATRVELGVVMTVAALFGGSDDPAHLGSFGPIPAELAREIVVGAVDQGEEVWLRRLFAGPMTGELVTMETRGRRFRGSLSRMVRLRDRVCRTVWCDAPVRHVDHVARSADDGPTSSRNAQGLCEACNYAKDAPGWRADPLPNGSIRTTTPTGHTHLTRPPPVATIRRAPPLTVDYVLAG